MNTTAHENAMETETYGEKETAFTPIEYNNHYFPPAKLESASAALSSAIEIAEDKGIPVAMNFDPEQEFPDQHGLAIRWIRARGQETPIGLVVAAIPTVELVANHPKGQEFIADVVASELTERAVTAVRPRGDAEFGGAMPASVEEFLATGRRESGKSTFNKIAGHFVKALKKKGVPGISKSVLEQVLASAAFASNLYPYPQDAWRKVLDAMITFAQREGLDTSLLEHWRDTRDEVEIEMPELDFGDLA